jgi:hypothetical protein
VSVKIPENVSTPTTIVKLVARGRGVPAVVFTRRFTLYVPIETPRLAAATWNVTSVPETVAGPKEMNGRFGRPSVSKLPTMRYRIAARPTMTRTTTITTTRTIRATFVVLGGGGKYGGPGGPYGGGYVGG